MEPAAPRAHAEGRGRRARAREPADGVGRGLPVRLPEPRAPLTDSRGLRRTPPSSDGNEEQFEAGDAYYVGAGHTPILYTGTEVVEFSPSEEPAGRWRS